MFEVAHDNKINDKEKFKSKLDSFVLNDISHHYYDDMGFFHCGLLDFLMDRVELF